MTPGIENLLYPASWDLIYAAQYKVATLTMARKKPITPSDYLNYLVIYFFRLLDTFFKKNRYVVTTKLKR